MGRTQDWEREMGRALGGYQPTRDTDPRDDDDALGLQEARDASDPGPSIGHQRYEPAEDVDDETHPITGEAPSWRDRYDRAEEWRGER